MADTVLTQTQLENFFQSLTSGFLGVTDPSVVRITWPQGGAPSWEIAQDVCFVTITPADDAYTHPVQTDYSALDTYNATSSLVYTAGVRVAWNFYGPSSYDNADLVRSRLFMDSTTTSLKASNLALITDVPMPTRVPELYSGQWWNRSMLWATFNQLVIRQSSVPYLQTADLKTQEG